MTEPDSIGRLPLSQEHRAILERSGISPEVIAERGYWSAPEWKTLKAGGVLNFRGTQLHAESFPAMVIPQHDPAGEHPYSVLRWDRPRITKAGKPIKYDVPAKIALRLDVPPSCRLALADPDLPLWITEGSKKADALASRGIVAINVPGVWAWKVPSLQADFDSIVLGGREVVIAFDSDILTNAQVRLAGLRLARWLQNRRAVVSMLAWSTLLEQRGMINLAKTGVDDLLADGHELEELQRAVVPFDKWLSETDDDLTGPYVIDHGRICFRKRERDGDVLIPLANFSARIVSQIVADDGANERCELRIDGTSDDGRPLGIARVPISQFAAMSWPVVAWGTNAVVGAGMGTRDRLRAAIQLLSGHVPQSRVYEHSGWRKINDLWLYLHADGAIGPNGPVDGIEVSMGGPLARLQLPDPPQGEGLRQAVRASLDLLAVASDAVMVPLIAAAYRAPLAEVSPVDLAVHISGPTGVFKSELAALLQAHFGKGFDRHHLPAAWSATANFLERLAFEAKDALMVVDDFAPSGSPADIARLHATADRLLRGAGNQAGRGRMAADTQLRQTYAPRGLILSTGEDVPRGHSLRARIAVDAVGPEDVNMAHLSKAQQDARAGLYAQAMAGYIRWLAPQIDQLRATMRDRAASLREQAHQAVLHRRTPDAVASLMLGWDLWLHFAVDISAISTSEANVIRNRAWAALGLMAQDQAEHQASEDPARQFLSLVRSAIVAGRAHLADGGGAAPVNANRWGWRESAVGTGEYQRPEWRPQGQRIGWLDADNLFLEPGATYAAAQALARDQGSIIGVTDRTLWKRLSEKGLLASVDTGRGKHTVRHTLEGVRRPVLHILAERLWGDGTDTTGPAGPLGPGSAPPFVDRSGFGPEHGPEAAAPDGLRAHDTGPIPGARCLDPDDAGRIGLFGPIGPGLAEASAPCSVCGSLAWWERKQEHGGGRVCGECHPQPTGHFAPPDRP